MDVVQDSRLAGGDPSEALAGLSSTISNARRSLDVASLVVRYEAGGRVALVEALALAWDCGASAALASVPERRRPQYCP